MESAVRRRGPIETERQLEACQASLVWAYLAVLSARAEALGTRVVLAYSLAVTWRCKKGLISGPSLPVGYQWRLGDV